MIITLSGEPGSGKTLTMIHLALMENQTKKVIHNIRGMKKNYINNQHLLTRNDIFKKILNEKKSNSKTTYYKIGVNWEFWVQNAGSTIMLDEAHELFYSRNFVSEENKAASALTAQIRKLCKDSGNFSDMRLIQRFPNQIFSAVIYNCLSKHNNMYVTSQTTSKIEKDVRDLSQVHIHCHSIHVGEYMIVYNDFYFIDAQYNALEQFESQMIKPKRAMFIANKYFKMYDRFAIIDMKGEYV